MGVVASCLRELLHFLFSRHCDGKARLPPVPSRLPCEGFGDEARRPCCCGCFPAAMEFRSAPRSSSLKPRRMPQRKPPFSPFLRGTRLGRWLHRSLLFQLMPLFEAVDNRRGLLGGRRRIHGLREHSLPLQRRSCSKLPTIPVAWTQCTAEGATGVGFIDTTGAQSRFIAGRREPRVDSASALGATTNCHSCCPLLCSGAFCSPLLCSPPLFILGRWGLVPKRLTTQYSFWKKTLLISRLGHCACVDTFRLCLAAVVPSSRAAGVERVGSPSTAIRNVVDVPDQLFGVCCPQLLRAFCN